MQLCTSQEQYLQQLLLAEELGKVVRTHGEPSSPSHSTSDGVGRVGSGDLLCSAAQLHHSLEIGPETTLLGLQREHFQRAAGEDGQDSKVCVCVYEESPCS